MVERDTVLKPCSAQVDWPMECSSIERGMISESSTVEDGRASELGPSEADVRTEYDPLEKRTAED